MKNVTVSIQIQFDVHSDNEEDIKNEVVNTLDSMSQNLQRYYLEQSPIIFTNSIDSSDIEIHKTENEDF